jgi:hypothetical protein
VYFAQYKTVETDACAFRLQNKMTREINKTYSYISQLCYIISLHDYGENLFVL